MKRESRVGCLGALAAPGLEFVRGATTGGWGGGGDEVDGGDAGAGRGLGGIGASPGVDGEKVVVEVGAGGAVDGAAEELEGGAGGGSGGVEVGVDVGQPGDVVDEGRPGGKGHFGGGLGGEDEEEDISQTGIVVGGVGRHGGPEGFDGFEYEGDKVVPDGGEAAAEVVVAVGGVGVLDGEAEPGVEKRDVLGSGEALAVFVGETLVAAGDGEGPGLLVEGGELGQRLRPREGR